MTGPIVERRSRPVTIPSKQEFREVIGRFASGVTIITTNNDQQDFGSTVSAVSSLTDEPPMLLVCLNKNSATGQAVRASGVLAVNVLAEDHVELAGRFASRIPDKFAGVSFERDHNDSPLLLGSIAHLVCQVQECVEVSTHYVFLAEVQEALAYQGHPLAYFRGGFGRMEITPEAAHLAAVRDWVRASASDRQQPLDQEALRNASNLDANSLERCLRALVAEGMVGREAGSYVLVPIPDQVIFESYEAKLAIELGVADRTVETASPEQIARLRELMEVTLELVDGDRFVDVDRWIEANEAFHEYMVEMAGSSILMETYRRLGLPGLNRRALKASSLADPALLEDHRRLVEAYENRDGDLLRQVLSVHADRPRQIRGRESERDVSTPDTPQKISPATTVVRGQ